MRLLNKIHISMTKCWCSFPRNRNWSLE